MLLDLRRVRRGDLRIEEPLVPVALAELAAESLEHEEPVLFLLPVLNERVAHIEEDGADGHAAIVSGP